MVQQNDTIRLVISLDKTEYVQGEPIQITYYLQNISLYPINVQKEFRGWNHIKFCLINSNCEYQRLISGCYGFSGGVFNRGEYTGKTLYPAEKYGVTENLAWFAEGMHDCIPDSLLISSNHFCFNTIDPGKYILRTNYVVSADYKKLWNGIITSNDIEITVKEPEVEEQAAYYLFMQARYDVPCLEGLAFFLQKPSFKISEPNRYPEESYYLYTDIVEKYPTSIYAIYAKYYIALSYLRIDHREAFILFKELKESHPEFRTLEVRLALANCYKEFGMWKEYEGITDYLRYDRTIINSGIVTKLEKGL